ncbi:MAG: proline dehydrogenase family protein [Woeseiaceae bacterium]|nr:proline dehydrogenase family protein [Woeseiaceae bacterium]
MCIAEALLRIPDADTADRLIADKITAARWEDHLGASDSLFVNASTWGLMLTGRILKIDPAARRDPAHYLRRLAGQAGEPVVRAAMRQAMRIALGASSSMGRTIGEALKRGRTEAAARYRYSFDMLGEAAITAEDADGYFDAYSDAIEKIGASNTHSDIFSASGISVKLSALHPRYEFTKHRRVMDELVPRVTKLVLRARDAGIALTVDAEETDRLELSLEVFAEGTTGDRGRAGGPGAFGLAVQAYQRRAIDVIGFVAGMAGQHGGRIPVRLVKGAYWDTEIKHAQELGLADYPVFTRKSHTHASYLACARHMLASKNAIYPQFATHNAHTLASILHFAGSDNEFEFQRLHGMGEELYAEVTDPEKFDRPCRVYAPVGSPRGPAAVPGPAVARERLRHTSIVQPHRRRKRADRGNRG